MIYFQLFAEFLKIGLFTFGGGYAMIPLIKEVIIEHSWILEDEFYNFLGVCEATPGPISINMATYIGSSQAGLLGGLCATIGVVLPSFIIILFITTLMKKIIKNKYVLSFLDGVKPVVIGLILATAITLIIHLIGINSYNNITFDKVSTVTFFVLGLSYIYTKYHLKKNINNVTFIIMSAFVGILISTIFA